MQDPTLGKKNFNDKLVTVVTGDEKISGTTGIRTQGLKIPSLHSIAELPNHISRSLTIYHQILVPDYIALHLHPSVGQTSIPHTSPPYEDSSMNLFFLPHVGRQM